MTISIAWVRKRENFEEMFFASDSRLSGGQNFDACPKMLGLPRQDCAIAFAGVSGDGFSMMLQLSLAIEAFTPAKTRGVELPALRTHALKIFNAMSKRITTDIRGAEANFTDPGAAFLFGGYNWRSKSFELWSLQFDSTTHEYVAHTGSILCWDVQERKLVFQVDPRKEHLPIAMLAFAGDQSGAARRMLFSRLTKRIKSGESVDRLGMEPFEVIRDLLRNPNERRPANSQTIGGAPQLLRVSQSCQTSSFAVYWTVDGERRLHLQGRPVLPYETLNTFSIDPDDLRIQYLGYAGSSYVGLNRTLREEQDAEDAEADGPGADG